MQSVENDSNSRLKLFQLWYIIEHTSIRNINYDAFNRIINNILTDDVNLNHKITIIPTINDTIENKQIHLKDCTVLHFVYCYNSNINIFNNLLNRGADYTIKNGNGQTILQLIITKTIDKWEFDKVPFIKSVLSAHVKFQNSTNPRDNNGISHLHGACIANHIEAINLFLDNGESINEAVNFNAKEFAGYTPLHFAVEFCSIEVAEILVRRGANLNAKNSREQTPLDISIEMRLSKLDYVKRQRLDHFVDYTEACIKKISDTEKIIELLLSKQCSPTIGLSSLQVACSLKNLTIAESLLDQVTNIDESISIKSAVRPGYTALHFAADNCIEAVELLLKRGAKLDIEAAYGLTSFDICIDYYSIEDIHDVLSRTKTWTEVYLSDGKTNLLDILLATKDVDHFRLFLQNENVKELRIPSTSALWPKFTILHLAVMFSTCKDHGNYRRQKIYDENIVKQCLENGFDINVSEAKNQTPIHLAFRLGKENIVKLLLEHLNTRNEINNLADEDNLTYLHIGCIMKDETVVEKLLRNSSPNVAFQGNRSLIYTGFYISKKKLLAIGSTPLHIVASNGNSTIAEMLLRHGANLHAIDSHGYAPIHCLFHNSRFTSYDMDIIPITNVLFASLVEDLKDQIVDEFGLSYLHIACMFHKMEAIEKLLDLGSNVNPISRTGSPLLLVASNPNRQIISLLLRRGADVFAEIPSRTSSLLSITIPLEKETVIRSFVPLLWEKSDLQKRVEEKLGLTRLHIACYMRNEEAIKKAINERIDVNAQVYTDSKIFAGFTALHFLVNLDLFNQLIDVYDMVKLLLVHNADVTIMNTDKNTPVHLFSKNQRGFAEVERCKDLLLNAPQNFNVNPANIAGISHFHLSCCWHKVEIVEKFLKQQSFNVNQRTEFYSTSLHLVLDYYIEPNDDWTQLLKTVDLLLKYGADVNAKDIKGETPLHQRTVLRSPEMIILDKLLSYGADVRIKNVNGQTFIDRWPLINEIDYSKALEKCDYQTNSWNLLTGEGNIAKMLIASDRNIAICPDFKKLIDSSDLQKIDELGRTVIHNSVAYSPYNYSSELNLDTTANYNYAINSFIEKGVEIDHQDKSGQTALHYAAIMDNARAVAVLLSFGADINIIDINGNSNLSYAMEHSKQSVEFEDFKEVARIINLHIKKLQHLRLEIGQSDKNMLTDLKTCVCKPPYGFPPLMEEDPDGIMSLFFNQVERTKTMNIGVGSLTLFNFLNETGAVRFYPYMSVSERMTIDEYFNSINFNEFDELRSIINLQFRKMKARLGLIDSAISSLRKLLGFSVPGLCEEIARFLTNSDVINLIASTKLNILEKKEFKGLVHGISTLSCN